MGSETKPRPRLIPALTGLRGVAAVWVVLFHLELGSTIPIVRHGDLGVDVFFVLSGFILSHVYADRMDPYDVRQYLAFLRVRIARIYPLHLFMLLVLALAVIALPDFASEYPLAEQRFGASSFVASLLLVQNWVHWLPTCWNSPAWSLSAEWMAYLLFPAFMVATQHWRSRLVPLLLAGGALVAFIAALLLKGVDQPQVQGVPGMLRMGCEFACGCLLFRARANGLRSWPKLVERGVLGLLLVCLLVDGLIFLALFPIAAIVLLAAQERGLITRALATRPAVFLGEISYSIYLVHWVVVQLSNWVREPLMLDTRGIVLWDTGLLGVVLALSLLSYRWVERPARRWGRRVAARSAGPLPAARPIG